MWGEKDYRSMYFVWISIMILKKKKKEQMIKYDNVT